MQAHKDEITGVTLLNVLKKVHKLRGAGDLYNQKTEMGMFAQAEGCFVPNTNTCSCLNIMLMLTYHAHA